MHIRRTNVHQPKKQKITHTINIVRMRVPPQWKFFKRNSLHRPIACNNTIRHTPEITGALHMQHVLFVGISTKILETKQTKKKY